MLHHMTSRANLLLLRRGGSQRS
uniref:leu leader peptide n=1 Tax=Corynebacterium glutamicum (strain ATCC 13032 / DSM 20300 / JCM 1318 / BCRC 11384 / CCUG 27702 / LMG 3730 / NBRC 12168 / NCIMB 10025 / NRRL B-2784 / 534) TaxID=196627 RepID=LPL_CORGL|nr:RecName: Full=leu leader peptide; AltName: Full=leuA operon attenuator peptide [Corynebacterium glutamicum ATCC 13032]